MLLALVSPAAMRAQFQNATPEELKMTEDAKAPGAVAVYLYREETRDDLVHTYTYYERIKVLTEKGKELATVHKFYVHGMDNVIAIDGRTIHADGTVIPLAAKPADLMDFKAIGFQVNNVVFTLPSAEVGSILEYRLTFSSSPWRASEPAWDIQSAYYTHKAHFMFHPYVEPGRYLPDGEGGELDKLMTSERLAKGTVVSFDKSKQIFSLDLADIPAMPDEDWMPPMNTLRWRVEYYYTSAKNFDKFWVEAEKHWVRVVEDFTEPTGTIKKAAAETVAATDTDDQKARKLYAAVQKLDNTAFSRKKSEAERKVEKLKEIRRAEDVWKQQSGDEDEIALLYVSLARAAGLKVRPAQVVNRDRAIFDSRYLSTRQLDDYLAVVELDGKDVYLDPGQKMCPFGSLHWKHTLAAGLQLTGKEATPILTPSNSYKDATVHRVADLTIDGTGNVDGTVRFFMTGPDALHWRQLSLENDQDEVKKQFDESIQSELPDGVQAEFDHFAGIDDYEKSLTAVVTVKGSIGSATGKHFFLPGLFFETRAKHPFVAEEKRYTPIDVHYAKMEQDDVTYHLPAGFSVESLPHAASETWPERALLKLAAQPGADGVKVTRTLAYNFVILDPTNYPALRDFYQKVATADQQQLVLTASSTAKGN